MEFFITQMPESFLGRIEGFVFLLLFVGAVLAMHKLHNSDYREFSADQIKARKAKK